MAASIAMLATIVLPLRPTSPCSRRFIGASDSGILEDLFHNAALRRRLSAKGRTDFDPQAHCLIDLDL